MGAAARLNAMSEDEARDALRRCCASRRWGRAMLAARPFAGDEAMLRAADAAWISLEEADRREAYDAHPRLGDRSLQRAGAGTKDWAKGEQAGLDAADESVQRQLADGNRAYEERFGRVFLLCATGKSAAQVLEALRARLTNDAATEETVAAEEQRKITRLRLGKLAVEC
jgi:2-oxo-4-hydroxy-4-carboxy-5-ureidoimidazoline decarboxylase